MCEGNRRLAAAADCQRLPTAAVAGVLVGLNHAGSDDQVGLVRPPVDHQRAAAWSRAEVGQPGRVARVVVENLVTLDDLSAEFFLFLGRRAVAV